MQSEPHDASDPKARFYSYFFHQDPLFKGKHDRYVYSESRLRFNGFAECSTTTTRNIRFKFQTHNKVFELFYSIYNHNFCISDFGARRYHIWFDLDTINWILGSLPFFSQPNCRAVSKFEDNRTLDLSIGSNKWGKFVKIQESRREGSTFLIIPFDSNADGPKLFTKALAIFTKRATNLEVRSQVRVSEEHQDSQSHSPIGIAISPMPTDTGQTVNTQQSGDVTSSEGLVQDPTSAESNKQLVIFQTQAAPNYSLSTGQAEVFPPLPRIILSPSAPAFVPGLYSYAALFTHEQGTDAITKPEEDPFSNLNGQNLILSLNSVEDHAKERDGPILYTHSDGEDFVFIDSKLKPLQIDFSRCSKHPLHLRKELKGRKMYSPSQIVTRSKAKILEQGRKFNPIGWVEEEDVLDPQESHEDEVIKFFKLCCPHKIEEPKPISKPLTKTQKKKMKKKKKQSQLSDYGFDEEIEYAY
ncbi:unnamed protein product [Cuscuta campestris]|uniref:Uncharacterized protein n=1 Tax=Cuscuta campestris TaxID=132261 RepID=A0A484LWN7_9ASTE|nr:unnamed protein product [Cuscuta campestris]